MRALVCLLNGKSFQKTGRAFLRHTLPLCYPSLPFDFIHRDRMVKTFGLSCPTSTKNLGAIGIQFERSAPATCDRVLSRPKPNCQVYGSITSTSVERRLLCVCGTRGRLRRKSASDRTLLVVLQPEAILGLKSCKLSTRLDDHRAFSRTRLHTSRLTFRFADPQTNLPTQPQSYRRLPREVSSLF